MVKFKVQMLLLCMTRPLGKPVFLCRRPRLGMRGGGTRVESGWPLVSSARPWTHDSAPWSPASCLGKQWGAWHLSILSAELALEGSLALLFRGLKIGKGLWDVSHPGCAAQPFCESEQIWGRSHQSDRHEGWVCLATIWQVEEHELLYTSIVSLFLPYVQLVLSSESIPSGSIFSSLSLSHPTPRIPEHLITVCRF